MLRSAGCRRCSIGLNSKLLIYVIINVLMLLLYGCRTSTCHIRYEWVRFVVLIERSVQLLAFILGLLPGVLLALQIQRPFVVIGFHLDSLRSEVVGLLLDTQSSPPYLLFRSMGTDGFFELFGLQLVLPQILLVLLVNPLLLGLRPLGGNLIFLAACSKFSGLICTRLRYLFIPSS